MVPAFWLKFAHKALSTCIYFVKRMAYSYQSDHLEDPHLNALDKKLTRILRHKGTPCMTSDGWVNISALVEQFRCTRGEIETIATTSSKGGRPRFQCWWSYCTQRSHIVFIRAAWGRSYCTQRSHRERRLDAELERLSSIFTSAPSFSSSADTDPPSEE